MTNRFKYLASATIFALPSATVIVAETSESLIKTHPSQGEVTVVEGATNIVTHMAGKPDEALLRKVADAETLLISTGAEDWLTSNGEAVKVNGGMKSLQPSIFQAGSPAGEILVRSAIKHPDAGDGEVIHFAVPMSADGITLANNWRAMGMRASGSQSIMLDRVFVSEDAITLRRPSGSFHPLYFVVLGAGLPLIMSVDVGIAKKGLRNWRLTMPRNGVMIQSYNFRSARWWPC